MPTNNTPRNGTNPAHRSSIFRPLNFSNATKISSQRPTMAGTSSSMWLQASARHYIVLDRSGKKPLHSRRLYPFRVHMFPLPVFQPISLEIFFGHKLTSNSPNRCRALEGMAFGCPSEILPTKPCPRDPTGDEHDMESEPRFGAAILPKLRMRKAFQRNTTLRPTKLSFPFPKLHCYAWLAARRAAYLMTDYSTDCSADCATDYCTLTGVGDDYLP
ncbi:hypothetical protein HDK90DRAFT_470962 [Phyllosticta capitalensis]|uniref:Uncharacterized protein n=1 Tax=Phyllosticta capitalensis TaxID=121624 RepID=A0ABR1Y8K1_9PEZI